MKVTIVGATGQMGKVLIDLWQEKRPEDELIKVALEAETEKGIFSLDTAQPADVVVDFSHASTLPKVLSYCTANGTPLVLATTGHDEAGRKRIAEAAATIPVFYSANLSLGVYVLRKAAELVAGYLGDIADMEVIEKHHNRKKDAPSGTAVMLVDALEQTVGERPKVYGREGMAPRTPGEIGIHAVRAGTIVGEHTVLFGLENETLELTHRGESKRLFAAGALKAAEFIASQEPGIYGMDELMKGSREQ